MKTIEEALKNLPKEPGIYQYFDENGKLLYIGKAKNLSKRVKSYWRIRPSLEAKYPLTTRIGRMLAQAKYLDFIVVSSEEDALILENSLIKQLKPKYNILLRDDKTYPYIAIDLAQDFPRFEITRKVLSSSKVKYYGPFPSGAKDLLDAIYDNYPLVQKKSCLKGKKACLFYEIKKCLAPCEGKVSKQEYDKIVKEAQKAIENRSILLKKLEERMFFLASNERFEEAAKIRDQIQSIKSLQLKSTIDLANSANYDIFAIATDKKQGVIVKIFMRNGKIVSSTHSFFKNIEFFDKNEAYKQALISHYKLKLSVDMQSILVAHDFEERVQSAATISSLLGKKIKVEFPKSGNKKKLIELALKNAQELLKQNKEKKSIEEEIAKLLNLERIPMRIEVFDNSHMMGHASVGAMVVWDNGEWDKSSYRRYELSAKDEYAQMRELLQRRIKRFEEENPPDLWLLDGGVGQINIALELLQKYQVNLDVVALAKEKLDFKAHRAKGSAKDIIYTQNGEIIELKKTDKRLIFLQKLRDEAHRFAIAYHRLKKQQEDLKLSLLEKKGVGKGNLKKLLQYFGSFDKIQEASFEEIAKITNKKVAKAIKM